MPFDSIPTEATPVCEAVRELQSGLLSIENAARAIDERADDGFDADQTVALAHLITREAYRLQESLDPLKEALKSPQRTRPSYWSNVERAETEGLTDEQVAAELRRYEWKVERVIAADETYEDAYRVSHTWTAKGLRVFLGERRFLGGFYEDDEQVADQEPQETTECANVIENADRNRPALDIFDGLYNRLRWAEGTLCALAYVELEGPDDNAIDSARHQVTEAKQLVEQLRKLVFPPVTPNDDQKQHAFNRGHRDSLWHAEQAIKETVKVLGMDRLNADGSFQESQL